MKHILFAVFSLTILTSGAFASETCTPVTEVRGNILLSRTYYSDDGTCNLSVSNKNNEIIYRDYSFGNTGGILVFSNYGEFDGQHRFGTREFFFLPKKNAFPDYVWNDEKQELEIIMTSGDRAIFRYDTAELQAIENAVINVNNDLHPRSKGGLEILSYKGIVIDTGFSLDRLNSQNQIFLSTITDSQSRTCKISNRSLFKYYSNGNVDFKLTNEELKALLKKQCPQLSY